MARVLLLACPGVALILDAVVDSLPKKSSQPFEVALGSYSATAAHP